MMRNTGRGGCEATYAFDTDGDNDKMPSRSLAGKIWITGTSSLIAFIAYSSQIFVIWPWYGYEISVDLLVLLVPFK
jgi:hypothetical protein